jgi:cystathionine beta-lyase/cystathionine gamma-synthase
MLRVHTKKLQAMCSDKETDKFQNLLKLFDEAESLRGNQTSSQIFSTL